MSSSIRRVLAPALLFSGLLVAGVAARRWTPPDAEETAVRAVLAEYFAGQSSGDGAHYKKIFYPTSNLYGMRDGKYMERTSAEFIAGAKAGPNDPSVRREIVSVDVTGPGAIAKLSTTHPAGRTVDYMSLLKIDGEWKIVAKTWVMLPPASH